MAQDFHLIDPGRDTGKREFIIAPNSVCELSLLKKNLVNFFSSWLVVVVTKNLKPETGNQPVGLMVQEPIFPLSVPEFSKNRTFNQFKDEGLDKTPKIAKTNAVFSSL